MSAPDSTVWFHADDYGVSRAESLRILECAGSGALNSISIMTNAAGFEESMQLLASDPRGKALRQVVHLNLVEGLPAAPRSEVPHLLNVQGHLACSFTGLMRWCVSGERDTLRRELSTEIAAQIRRWTDWSGTKRVSLDSHRHVHMIPIVWDALNDAVRSEGLTVEWLRVPVDPVGPILSTPTLWPRVSPINVVKWILLKALAPSPEAVRALTGQVPLFFGMFFTCQMQYESVAPLLPKYQKAARRAGRTLELMFHPGKVTEPAELLDGPQSAFAEFYQSGWRDREADTLRRFGTRAE